MTVAHTDFIPVEARVFPSNFQQIASAELESILPHISKDSLKKIKTLGEGTIGGVKVHLRRTPNQELCVTKMFPRAALDVAAGLESPRNEFYAALFLQGLDLDLPYIQKFLFAAQDEKNFYLGSEHYPHSDLFTMVKTKGRILDDATLRELLQQMLVGIRGLHEMGIAHRDLSLENIVIDKEGDLRIIDFAQAVMVRAQNSGSPEAHVRISAEHGPPGKVPYRAPELTVDEQYLATKVDMFSIGVMFYAIVMQQYPKFEELFPAADSHLDRCTHLRLSMQRCSSSIIDKLSPGCLDMLEQLMAPNPELRLSADEALMHPWLLGTIAGFWPVMLEEPEKDEIDTTKIDFPEDTVPVKSDC